jgi:hypothetical protein
MTEKLSFSDKLKADKIASKSAREKAFKDFHTDMIKASKEVFEPREKKIKKEKK